MTEFWLIPAPRRRSNINDGEPPKQPGAFGRDPTRSRGQPFIAARPPHLEQAPKKLIDFFDKSLLQHFDFERILIVRTIPFERKAL